MVGSKGSSLFDSITENSRRSIMGNNTYLYNAILLEDQLDNLNFRGVKFKLLTKLLPKYSSQLSIKGGIFFNAPKGFLGTIVSNSVGSRIFNIFRGTPQPHIDTRFDSGWELPWGTRETNLYPSAYDVGYTLYEDTANKYIFNDRDLHMRTLGQNSLVVGNTAGFKYTTLNNLGLIELLQELYLDTSEVYPATMKANTVIRMGGDNSYNNRLLLKNIIKRSSNKGPFTVTRRSKVQSKNIRSFKHIPSLSDLHRVSLFTGESYKQLSKYQQSRWEIRKNLDYRDKMSKIRLVSPSKLPVTLENKVKWGEKKINLSSLRIYTDPKLSFDPFGWYRRFRLTRQRLFESRVRSRVGRARYFRRKYNLTGREYKRAYPLFRRLQYRKIRKHV
jgi:hypothetical protein